MIDPMHAPITAFKTDTGLIVPTITAVQMREVDRIAIEQTGPNLYQMMENAGRNLAALTLEHLADVWRDAHVVILAGSGGNGGGGICAARHLANRGVRTSLVVAAPDRLGEVPAWQLDVYCATSGAVVDAGTVGTITPDLILDALIGYGLQAAPRGRAAELIEWANAEDVTILSLDVPSGVHSTTGDTPGEPIRPTATMTLALPKTGLIPERTGDLVLADIGIPEETFHLAGIQYVSPFDTRWRLPLDSARQG